jgi:hypothetical protein
MPKKTIESLRAALVAALLAGEDASAIRAELGAATRAQHCQAEQRASVHAQAEAAESAAIQREAGLRADASASRLRNLLSSLDA